MENPIVIMACTNHSWEIQNILARLARALSKHQLTSGKR
jgi:hypothetical protein